MGRLREVKSGDEIDLLRASAHTADDAMQSALAACRAGATELEVAEAARAGFSEAGVDQRHLHDRRIGSERRVPASPHGRDASSRSATQS